MLLRVQHITITINDPFWVERSKNAALLVIHTIFRPLHPYGPLKRDDPLSLHKLAGEFKLVGHNNCLGWYIQTYYLRVFLPREKDTDWLQYIRASLSLTKINTDKLESPIGKLNHASHIITLYRYFLNWIHHLLKMEISGSQNSSIPGTDKTSTAV